MTLKDTPLEDRPLIERVGIILYGAAWQTAMSLGLKVHDRTIRRWASGETPLPPGVIRDLRELAIKRRQEISEMVAELRTITQGQAEGPPPDQTTGGHT